MKSINLLPVKQKSNSKNPKLLPLMLLLMLILLSAQLYYTKTWQAEASRFQQESLRSEQEADKIRNNGDLKVKVDAYKQAEQMIAQLELNRTEWKSYLAAIIGNLPLTTKIVTISASDDLKISMELDFVNASEVIQYMKDLEDNDKLQDVVLSSFYKKVDEQTSAEAVTSGTNGETVIEMKRKEVYKLTLVIELNKEKGAQ